MAGTSARVDVADVGLRITRRREQLGIRQAELARRAKLSEAYINRLENGIVRNPKVNDLAKVAEALQVPLRALLTGDRAPAQPDVASLLAEDPRLMGLFTSIVRGLEVAPHQDRDFVLEHLETLARRFGQPLQSTSPSENDLAANPS
ncbi:MAG: helix-turn-helix domain-containing protein [Chloroflexi bacterium]|nr:helix-turn-helix domain-containing protein [Chloroflexota bacterium]